MVGRRLLRLVVPPYVLTILYCEGQDAELSWKVEQLYLLGKDNRHDLPFAVIFSVGVDRMGISGRVRPSRRVADDHEYMVPGAVARKGRNRPRPVPADRTVAEAVQVPGLVSRCETGHLGRVGTGVGAGAGRLVCAPTV